MGVANSAVHVRIGLQRFQVAKNHKRLVARGSVLATYTSNGKTQATTTKAVTLAVQATGTCRVLHLELGELDLSLLGLIVTLTPVDAPSITLDITADSSEALGKLLCQVINAVQGATIQPTSVKLRKLNTAVHEKYAGGIANFDIPLDQKSPAATTTTSTTATTTTSSGPTIPAGQCQVLDLVLGPLHLDLLGLIVDLNKIQLQITANPVGTLGTLFCQLAGTTVTSTSTTASTASTTSTTTTTTTP